MMHSFSQTLLSILLVCNVFYSSQAFSQILPDDFHSFQHAERSLLEKNIKSRANLDLGKLEQQRMFDVLYYRLDIAINPDSKTIDGVLDLSNNLEVTTVSGAGIDTFIHEQDILTIHLASTLEIDDHTTISISYNGTPQPEGLGSFIFGSSEDGGPLIWTLSQPFFAHTWWPCKDLPEDKADSVDVTITVPEDLTAVSNGILNDVIENGNGTRTFAWHEGYPIASYLVSLAVADYDFRRDYFVTADGDSLPLEFYVTKEKSERAFSPSSAFQKTEDMLEVFTGLFGPYPFIDEKFAQVEFGAGGGMEHQTAVSLNVPRLGPSEFLVSHELAHQWWGDMITCRDWEHIWLNEGFATYSEALYIETHSGKTALKDFMVAITAPEDEWGSLIRNNTGSAESILADVAFDKGAWVLHMLRTIVGNEMFFKILRSYASDPAYQYSTVVTDDFQEVAEREYGTSLSWFFDQWVYNDGRPHYQIGWNVLNDESEYNVKVTIDQTQSGIVYQMPLDIFIETLDGKSEVFSVLNNSRRQEYTFMVDEEPFHVTLDDSNKVLKEIDVDIVRPAVIPEFFTLLPNFPNPFNPSTIVHFKTRITAHVTLKIYSVTGQEIKTVVSETLAQGVYRFPWDGTNNSGKPVAGGIYLARMTSNNFTDVIKMVLVR